jgi:methylated-DNA-[protein]-cysteine S-methyltransferase
MMIELFLKTITTPVGTLTIFAGDKALFYISWTDQIEQLLRFVPSLKKQELKLKSKNKITNMVEIQLLQYFNHQLTVFDIPLKIEGTPFQKSVWDQLKTIPYGQTRSYKYIAKTIQKPNAVRAVGIANGRNPIPIILPCHRVIQSNGKLGGYSAGLWIKDWLLRHEQAIL